MNGLSTNRRCTTAARCLQQDGVEFIIRYYSETTAQPEKRLTPVEARAIDAAGIRHAVVYQDRQNQAADFSQAAGERDGQFAFQYAREIGQPFDTTIFFFFSQSGPMPFAYTVGARDIRKKAIAAGLTTYDDPTVTAPLPGDIVVWWRVALKRWEGHVGYVHHVANGRIYTIEGNKTSKVEGFSYPLASMDRLLGFVRL